MSSKQASKALEISSEGQTIEGRSGASKEWHVLPLKLKGQDEHSTFLMLL